MSILKVPTLTSLAAIGLLATSPLEATPLINWGTNLPDSRNVALNLGTASDYNKTRIWWNAQSPASGYADTPFRAILEQTLSISGAQNLKYATLHYSSASLWVQGESESSTPSSTVIRGLIAFDQSSFLNGGDSSTVTLGDESTMSLDIRKTTGVISVRMAVLDGTQWYLSANSVSGSGNFSLTQFSGESWGQWSPSGAGTLPIVPDHFPVQSTSFTDIKGFGFYFESTQTRIDRVAEVQFTGFQVNAVTAIPEPSTAMLSGVAILGTGLLRLRHRSRK